MVSLSLNYNKTKGTSDLESLFISKNDLISKSLILYIKFTSSECKWQNFETFQINPRLTVQSYSLHQPTLATKSHARFKETESNSKVMVFMSSVFTAIQKSVKFSS